MFRESQTCAVFRYRPMRACVSMQTVDCSAVSTKKISAHVQACSLFDVRAASRELHVEPDLRIILRAWVRRDRIVDKLRLEHLCASGGTLEPAHKVDTQEP
jgi:plasmid replication initiation protein